MQREEAANVSGKHNIQSTFVMLTGVWHRDDVHRTTSIASLERVILQIAVGRRSCPEQLYYYGPGLAMTGLRKLS